MANDNNDQDVADILKLLESSDEQPTDSAAVASLGDLEDISPFIGDDINFAQLLHSSSSSAATSAPYQAQPASLSQQPYQLHGQQQPYPRLQQQQQQQQQQQGLQRGAASGTVEPQGMVAMKNADPFAPTSTLHQRPPSTGALSPVGGDLQSFLALLDAPTAHAELPEFPFLGDAGFLSEGSAHAPASTTPTTTSQPAPLEQRQRRQQQQQQSQALEKDGRGDDGEEEEEEEQEQQGQQELVNIKSEAVLPSGGPLEAGFSDGRSQQSTSNTTNTSSLGAGTTSNQRKGGRKSATKAAQAASGAANEQWQDTLTSPTMALDPRKMTTRPAISAVKAETANGGGSGSGGGTGTGTAQQRTAGRRGSGDGARGSSSSAGSGKQGGSQRKRPHNKASADKYRRRKKERFESMQQDVERYTRENTELAVKASRLENEKAFLCTLLESAIRNSADPFTALLNVPQELITPAMLPAQVKPELFEQSKRVIQQFVEDSDAQVASRVASLEGKVQELVGKLGTQSATSTSSAPTTAAAPSSAATAGSQPP